MLLLFRISLIFLMIYVIMVLLKRFFSCEGDLNSTFILFINFIDLFLFNFPNCAIECLFCVCIDLNITILAASSYKVRGINNGIILILFTLLDTLHILNPLLHAIDFSFMLLKLIAMMIRDSIPSNYSRSKLF